MARKDSTGLKFTDIEALKAEYICSDITKKELAERYNLNISKLYKISKSWDKERDIYIRAKKEEIRGDWQAREDRLFKKQRKMLSDYESLLQNVIDKIADTSEKVDSGKEIEGLSRALKDIGIAVDKCATVSRNVNGQLSAKEQSDLELNKERLRLQSENTASVDGLSITIQGLNNFHSDNCAEEKRKQRNVTRLFDSFIASFLSLFLRLPSPSCLPSPSPPIASSGICRQGGREAQDESESRSARPLIYLPVLIPTLSRYSKFRRGITFSAFMACKNFLTDFSL